MQSYNPATLAAGYKSLFFRSISGMEKIVWAQRVCSVVSSDGPDETYSWIGQSPQMVELKGEFQVTPLSDTSYTITNLTYGAVLSVKRADIEDDRQGGYALRIGQMAGVAMAHRNLIVSNLLANGTTDTCYDGAAYFADAHPARGDEGGTQDNLLAGSGITTANFQTDLSTGIGTMMGFTAENGEPAVEMPTRFTCVVPPGNVWTLKEALKSQEVSNTTNVRFDGIDFDVIVDPRLSDTNDWFLLFTGGNGMMPLIWQDRVPLEFTAQEQGDQSFWRDQYNYRTRARYNAGYGPWQYAVKFVNS